MKLTGFALAIAVIVAPLSGAAAQPQQRHVEVHRSVTRTVVHKAPRVRHRERVCRTRWVNHRKVRRCTYRYR